MPGRAPPSRVTMPGLGRALQARAGQRRHLQSDLRRLVLPELQQLLHRRRAGQRPLPAASQSITPEWLEEENYFFALSKYTERLQKHSGGAPRVRDASAWRPEMMALLESGLHDFSVSRQVQARNRAVGHPGAGRSGHVLYVWFDALTTYITAIGFPDDTGPVRPLLAGRLPGDRQGHHPLPLSSTGRRC